MTDFKLDKEYIKLYVLLKIANIAETGGASKHMIAESEVTVDGVLETRKAYKVRSGQTVKVGNETIHIVK